MVRVTVSGPFRRAPVQVAVAVWAMRAAGADVLSPREPRIVDALGDFVFVASDRSRTIRTVQDAHLDAISRSDLLWLVAPDGHLGDSAAMEVGWAMHAGVPVLSRDVLRDVTYRQYVKVVDDEHAAVTAARSKWPPAADVGESLLLDPEKAAAAAHEELARVESLLLRPTAAAQGRDTVLEGSLGRLRRLTCTPLHVRRRGQ